MIKKINSIFLHLSTIITIILLSSTPGFAAAKRRDPSTTTNNNKSVKPSLYTNFLEYKYGKSQNITNGGGARPFKPVDFLFPDTCRLYPYASLEWQFTIGVKHQNVQDWSIWFKAWLVSNPLSLRSWLFSDTNHLRLDKTEQKYVDDVWSMLPIYGGQEYRRTRFGNLTTNKELKWPLPRDQPGAEEERKSKTDRFAIGLYKPRKMKNKWVRDFMCVEKGVSGDTFKHEDYLGKKFDTSSMINVPLEYDKSLLHVSNATNINGVRMKDLVANRCIWIVTDFLGYQETPWRQLVNEQTAQLMEYRTGVKHLPEISLTVSNSLKASDEVLSYFPDYEAKERKDVKAVGGLDKLFPNQRRFVLGREIVQSKYLIYIDCRGEIGDHENGAKRYDNIYGGTKNWTEYNPPAMSRPSFGDVLRYDAYFPRNETQDDDESTKNKIKHTKFWHH